MGGTRKCGAYIGPAEAAASARGWRPNSPPQDTGAATPDSLAATDRFIRQASYASLLALLPVCSALRRLCSIVSRLRFFVALTIASLPLAAGIPTFEIARRFLTDAAAIHVQLEEADAGA